MMCSATDVPAGRAGVLPVGDGVPLEGQVRVMCRMDGARVVHNLSIGEDLMRHFLDEFVPHWRGITVCLEGSLSDGLSIFRDAGDDTYQLLNVNQKGRASVRVLSPERIGGLVMNVNDDLMLDAIVIRGHIRILGGQVAEEQPAKEQPVEAPDDRLVSTVEISFPIRAPIPFDPAVYAEYMLYFFQRQEHVAYFSMNTLLCRFAAGNKKKALVWVEKKPTQLDLVRALRLLEARGLVKLCRIVPGRRRGVADHSWVQILPDVYGVKLKKIGDSERHTPVHAGSRWARHCYVFYDELNGQLVTDKPVKKPKFVTRQPDKDQGSLKLTKPPAPPAPPATPPTDQSAYETYIAKVVRLKTLIAQIKEMRAEARAIHAEYGNLIEITEVNGEFQVKVTL